MRRERPELKQVTIATVTQEQLARSDAEHLGRADIIVCVDAAVPGSY